MDDASITTCMADRSTRSAIRITPANVLNRPRTRASPMCLAVKAMEECVGSISQSPNAGSAGGRVTCSVTSPSEAIAFSTTVAFSRYGA